MPELPEVETIRRGLAAQLDGGRVLAVRLQRRDLRFPLPRDFAARLMGRRMLAWRRRAKYLMLHLAGAGKSGGEDILFIHLGMSGRMLLHARTLPPLGAHDHVVWDLAVRRRRLWLVFRDPRRFGYMGLMAAADATTHPRFRALGAEPLARALTPDQLAARLAGARTSLKAFLLNQRHIVGLGNIYACEALYAARLHPAHDAARARPHAASLQRAIRGTLTRALAAGGSSLGQGQGNFVAASGEMGYFQLRFHVYDRAGRACRRRGCGGTIERFVQNGRSSFACPHCQRVR